jgi:hypothetical protein
MNNAELWALAEQGQIEQWSLFADQSGTEITWTGRSFQSVEKIDGMYVGMCLGDNWTLIGINEDARCNPSISISTLLQSSEICTKHQAQIIEKCIIDKNSVTDKEICASFSKNIACNIISLLRAISWGEARGIYDNMLYL